MGTASVQNILTPGSLKNPRDSARKLGIPELLGRLHGDLTAAPRCSRVGQGDAPVAGQDTACCRTRLPSVFGVGTGSLAEQLVEAGVKNMASARGASI